MKVWLSRQWNDPAIFIGNVRWCMFILGGLFATNQIPTYINGLGPVIGIVLNAFAVKMAAGDQTPPIVEDAARVLVGRAPSSKE